MGRWGGRDCVDKAPARDAKVTSTFGSRFEEANRKAQENSKLASEEWEKRFVIAKAKYDAAKEEGEQRKDNRGAYPKDVQRKQSKALEEMDTARQYGKLDHYGKKKP